MAFPYTRHQSDWQDGPGGGTPITQAALDTIEDGIVSVSNLLNGNVARVNLATITRKAQCIPGYPGATPDFSWGAAAIETASWTFLVPDDYVSGDLTFRLLIRGSNTEANTAVIARSVYRFRDGVAYVNVELGIAMNQIGFTAAVAITKTFTIAAANFQAGDVIRVDPSRQGSDGADTYTGIVDNDALYVEYLGRA